MAVRTGPQPMPGGMPPMPGIMGAPMGPPAGMPGMGGMPGLPPMQQPMPMPMGGPLGGPAPQVQGGGRPASLGTLPAPSTAEQRAGFGAAVGAVAGMPVMGALPSDVFAGGIPGGMMDASIPRPVAQMREGGVAYMQAGGVAKPSMREFMESVAGVPIEQMDEQTYNNLASQASQLLYGSVGSNVDIRDWNAIMSSSDPTRAAQEATRQMYSTGAPVATDPRFYDPKTGAYTPTASGYEGSLPVAGTNLKVLDGNIYITDAAGLPLTGLSPQNAASFGISQADIDAAIAAGGSSQEGRLSGAGYQPYDAGDLLRSDYQSLLTGPRVSPVVSSGGGTSAPSGTGGGGGQQGYVAAAGAVPVSQPGGGIMNALPGEVLQTSAGPMAGSVYQPTVSSIPTFVGGVSDVFGTRPVTYVGSPQATIRSRIGEIDLPARPQSINIFDFLASPVSGYGGLR